MIECYQCAACQRYFLTKEAVDGFQEGYSRGFLCPHCGTNLEEAGESDSMRNLEYGILYSLFLLVVLVIMNFGAVQLTLTYDPVIDGLATFGAMIFLPTLVFAWINRRVLMGARVVFTRRVSRK